jgi:hypothetical protein
VDEIRKMQKQIDELAAEVAQLKQQMKRQPQRRFIPPDVSEVAAYASEYQDSTGLHGWSFDAQRFVDHYTANGWKVGRNAMKDWRAAVRNWHKDSAPNDRPAVSAGQRMLQRGFDG